MAVSKGKAAPASVPPKAKAAKPEPEKVVSVAEHPAVVAAASEPNNPIPASRITLTDEDLAEWAKKKD